MNNMFNPFFPSPFGVPRVGRRRSCLKEVRTFELPVNGMVVSDETLDLGINPCLYRELPCECFVILKVREPIPAAADGLPVTVVTPSGSTTSTTTPGSSTTGNKKNPVIDHDNNPVTGSDLSAYTDAYVFIDKSLGIFRFVNFRTGGGTPVNTPADGGQTPAVVNK